MSRWMMAALWACARPAHSSIISLSFCDTDSGARRLMISASVSPRTYSITMNGASSYSPVS